MLNQKGAVGRAVLGPSESPVASSSPDPFVPLEFSKGPTPVTAADIDAAFARAFLVALYILVRHDEVTAEIELIGPSCWSPLP